MTQRTDETNYGVGILGNCCTHGAGVARGLAAHPRLHLVAGYEPGGWRGAGLRHVLERDLAASCAEVAGHRDVDIAVVTTDPCYKAEMVELAVGKQALEGDRGSRNALSIEFETANLFLDPGAEVFVHNGRPDSLCAFVGDHTAPTAIDQLLTALEGGGPPDSDVATAADGVEVLCAAYLSALEDRLVDLPLAEPRNPLFE